MLHLIYCEEDDSFCVVEDKDVIYDVKHPLTDGDEIRFFWKDKKFLGTIIKSSVDGGVLNNLAKKMKKDKNKKKNSDESNETAFVQKCKLTTKKRGHSDDDEKDLTRSKRYCVNKSENEKKAFSASQSKIQSLILKAKSSSQLQERNENIRITKDSSPTKEDLKKMLAEKDMQLKLFTKAATPHASLASSSKNDDKSLSEKNNLSISLDDDEDDQVAGNECLNVKTEASNAGIRDPIIGNESVDEGRIQESSQMFGKDSGEPMVLLKNHIYCKKTIFDEAQNAVSASSIARRLLEGVFKKETLEKCTYSGRSANAQGAEKRSRAVVTLDNIGKTALLEYAMEYAERKNFKTKQTEKEVGHAMSQRIGEIKRQFEENEKIKKRT